MSDAYVSAEMRRSVALRAGACCEYCLLKMGTIAFPFQIDHIISEKHGGVTSEENLALSCIYCNAYKGSDIASEDPFTDKITRLYNPRTQVWETHFRRDHVTIVPLTPEGRVTVKLLRLNEERRVLEREALIEIGEYPCRVSAT